MADVNVLIAVPAYRGTIDAQTSSMVAETCIQFRSLGWSFSLSGKDNANVVDIRNFYASYALENDFTHLLFIDNDMRVRAQAFERLVRANKPVIGLACPMRGIDLDLFVKALSRGKDAALACAMRWNYQASELRINRGITPVRYLGTGIMLISCKVLRKLSTSAKRYERHAHRSAGLLRGDLLGFFDQIYTDRLLPEDYSFCHRWNEAGGEVSMIVDEIVGHVGQFVYQAKLADSFPSRPGQGTSVG